MTSRFWFLLLSLVALAPALSARASDEPRVERPAEDAARVDINTASVEELVTLPGIGPAKARAIVEYRSKRRFRSPAAIQRVKGIGRSTFARLKAHITVGNR